MINTNLPLEEQIRQFVGYLAMRVCSSTDSQEISAGITAIKDLLVLQVEQGHRLCPPEHRNLDGSPQGPEPDQGRPVVEDDAMPFRQITLEVIADRMEADEFVACVYGDVFLFQRFYNGGSFFTERHPAVHHVGTEEEWNDELITRFSSRGFRTRKSP